MAKKKVKTNPKDWEEKKSISFVMPCYNDADTVEDAVKSIRDQDLPDIEIIVVNDGSTDDSKIVLDALKEQGVIDKVIHLEKNSGACVARNLGTKEAKGKYLSFLPADAILYPGMARVWFNVLEDHPDYDFAYGGYRFIDDDGEPLPGHDYFFESFDPYLLETNNYIDGSFPIKTESFWKFAKIMNQPDGLWDPKIKSLQDWDFWLSVVKHGGKGVYIRDIFFGTTLPHKGGLSDDSSNNWLERLNAIKDKHNIPHRKICVASLGAAFHAKRVAYMLQADFKEIPSFKPHEYDALYVVGFYPEFSKQQDAMFFNNYFKPEEGRTAAKKIIHFVGTDIWQLYHVPLIHLRTIWHNYFRNNVDEILCEDEFTQTELRDLGIEAKVVPIPPSKLYEIRPLPKDFTVACYMPAMNREFYRPKEMAEIAKRMPDVKFKFFGNPAQKGTDPALTPNLEYVGYITDMDSFLSECSAIMRFPVHDGLPISVLEFLLAGRYSIQSTPVAQTFCVPNLDIDEVVKGLYNIKKLTETEGVNKLASDYWREKLDHEKFKKTIYDLASYNPKEYWEKRSESWIKQAASMDVEKEEIAKFIDEIKPKSVLDVGCGDGRWVPFLMEHGVEKYEGVDISWNLIRAAKDRFPHLKDNFHVGTVEELPDLAGVADLAFSYTCLEHITEAEFPKAVKALKKVAKQALIIEPENFQSRYYCHDHPYRKHFHVIKEQKLKDKIIFLVDLEKSNETTS